MRLAVKRDLSVWVTLPWHTPKKEAALFVKEKSTWILKKIDYFKKTRSFIKEPNKKDFLENKEKAGRIVEKKIRFFNSFYGFPVNKFRIRNPFSIWASCSENGNLNFSYRIVFLPEELQNYIIVHELCHLEEFNHSDSFWKLMSKTIPDYKKRREAIRLL